MRTSKIRKDQRCKGPSHIGTKGLKARRNEWMERRTGERIETPIDEGTKARRHEGTKARRHEGIEALSTKETARKREKRKYKEIETQRNVKKLRGKE